MAPTSTGEPTAAEVKAAEAAVEHAAENMVMRFVKSRAGVAVLALSLGSGGTAGLKTWLLDQPAHESKLGQELREFRRELRRDLCELKVKQQALLDVLPAGQRERANRLIADRMAVLALAGQQNHRPEP